MCVRERERVCVCVCVCVRACVGGGGGGGCGCVRASIGVHCACPAMAPRIFHCVKKVAMLFETCTPFYVSFYFYF